MSEADFTAPKEKRSRVDHDDAYFQCYADLRIHEEMLQDHHRTFTYRKAILRNFESIRGKVVVDVGAGTGILSIFCVQAGARKVYAIEASDFAKHTEEVVKENEMEDKITVIKGKVEEVELPEKVDVIVSEWMGYFLLYETMLPSVLYARDKWLKEDGILLPSEASIYLAPLSNPGGYEDRLSFWKELESRYKVKMNCLKPLAKRRLTHHVQLQSLVGEDIVGAPEEIVRLNLKTIDVKSLESITAEFVCLSFGTNRVHGLASWFSVFFPGDTELDTSPDSPETHWSQCILYFDEPCDVTQDSTFTGTITLKPSKQFRRWLDISLEYSVDGGETKFKKNYILDDDAPA